jgi:glycosyltransferase involved in cell wall biosynthesis
MTDTLLPEVRRRRLRGSIHYLGELPLTDVRACLRQADIFFLPSVWENCPYSILEAMAAGKAIVCTDHGGMPELIRDGRNGLLARNEDAASYIVQLNRVLDDDALRLRLGEAARQTVEASLTDVGIAERSVRFYREAFGHAA